MALPGTSLTILDGGLGVSSPATSVPHVVGPSESGTADTPTTISNQRQLKETFGTHGQGVDMAGYILDHAGGPIVFTKTQTSVAATYDGATTVAVTGPGGTDDNIDFTIATSAPLNDFDVVITMASAGARGTATFTYSLDGGRTTSPALTTGADVALGDSGVHAEFQAGSTNPYVAGTTYTVAARAAMYNTTDLSAAHTAIRLSQLDWDFFAYAGQGSTAGAGATLVAAVQTEMAAYATSIDKYFRAVISGGEDSAADALTAYSAVTADRVSIAHGEFRTSPVFGVTGRGLPYLPLSYFVAMRAAGNLMSTDLAKTAGAPSVGAMPGVNAADLTHNEFTQNAGLDNVKVSTSRTYSNLTGPFLTNAWLKSGVGSDFRYWQHGRMMDEACKVVSEQLSLMIASEFPVKADGTGQLRESSARDIEQRVQRALDNVIGSNIRGVGPSSIGGTIGHVSDQAFVVDRTTNFLSTETIVGTLAIVPKGYAKTLQSTISYKLSTT